MFYKFQKKPMRSRPSLTILLVQQVNLKKSESFIIITGARQKQFLTSVTHHVLLLIERKGRKSFFTSLQEEKLKQTATIETVNPFFILQSRNIVLR